MNRFFGQIDKRIGLAGLLVLAALVRLAGISSRPIWYDEAFSILFAGKGPAAMLAGTFPAGGRIAAEEHPLAYYTILWGWMKVFGESLPSVRLLSILIGIVTVFLAYSLLQAMFADSRLAFLGSLGVALSPFLVHYSQEIRMYGLLALALTGATAAYWQALHSKRWTWWVLFSFCAALAQYTHNLAAFYLIPLALTSVWLRRWDKVKMTVLAGLGAIVLYLPWLVHLPAQLAKIENAYWVERPGIGTVFTTLLSYVTNLPVDQHWLPAALAITLVVIVLAATQTWMAVRRKLPGARRGAWLAYLAFLPPVLTFIVSQWRPIYVERALLPSGVLFWLWLAWALTATGLPRLLRFSSYGLLAAGIVLGLVTHLSYAGFPYGPFDALDASLQARLRPGDVILHSNKLSILPSIYFDPALPQQFIADLPGSSTDTLAPATQKVLGVNSAPTMESATGNAKRVWLVIYREALDEASQSGLSRHPQLAWLDAHYSLVETETWGPVLLYLYSR